MAKYYILVGEQGNWLTAIENKIWGFSYNSKHFWNTIEEGDLLAFYSTIPIKKIFGFGRVTEKFTDDKLLWADEKNFNRVIWPFRIRFKVLLLLQDWNEGVSVPSKFILRTPRVKVEKQFFFRKLKVIQKKVNTPFVDLSKV